MPGKRFEFQLQSVLTLRESETEKARLALMRAVKKAQAQRERVEELRQQILDCMRPVSRTERGTAMRLRRDGTYRAQLQHQLVNEQRMLDAAARAEGHARNELATRRRKEETLRTLRASALDQHRAEQARIEHNESDELAMIASARRRKSA